MRYSQLMEGSSENLFKRNGGKIMAFADLPESAQKALHTYLGEYDEDAAYTRARYGYAMIPTEQLKKACWNAPDNDFSDEFDNWDEYHKWYWSQEKDANYKDHLKDMWPVILDDGEGILDGWHRLHWYCRNGAKKIPAILPVAEDPPKPSPDDRWAAMGI